MRFRSLGTLVIIKLNRLEILLISNSFVQCPLKVPDYGESFPIVEQIKSTWPWKTKKTIGEKCFSVSERERGLFK